MKIMPPVEFKVQSREEVVIAYALREYYAAITTFSEIMEYFDETGKYPAGKVREFKMHVLHLGMQLRKVIKLDGELDKLLLAPYQRDVSPIESFRKAFKLFRMLEERMKKEGFISTRKKTELVTRQKAEEVIYG